MDPISGEYVIGTCVATSNCPHKLSIDILHDFLSRPFFEKVTIDLPGSTTPLVISASGEPHGIYVKSLTVNSAPVQVPIIHHTDIAHGGTVVFEMSTRPESWANSTSTVRRDSTICVI